MRRLDDERAELTLERNTQRQHYSRVGDRREPDEYVAIFTELLHLPAAGAMARDRLIGHAANGERAGITLHVLGPVVAFEAEHQIVAILAIENRQGAIAGIGSGDVAIAGHRHDGGAHGVNHVFPVCIGQRHAAGTFNKFPNASYFSGWSSTEDEITWDVEALGEGDYEVEMYYTVAPENVGATIELTLGKSQLTRRIDIANPSPLIGPAEDRVERAEGYDQDWKPISLGVLHITPGRHTLRLRATNIPGQEVCDFRMLTFQRRQVAEAR